MRFDDLLFTIALPWLAPVSRELYGNIYALSLYDLLFPKQEAWALTQDQLLGGTADRQLRPASQVREGLYRQAMSLWRPDRRGKTRMEELEAKLRELHDQLNLAQRAQEQAGELEARQQECQQRRPDEQYPAHRGRTLLFFMPGRAFLPDHLAEMQLMERRYHPAARQRGEQKARQRRHAHRNDLGKVHGDSIRQLHCCFYNIH